MPIQCLSLPLLKSFVTRSRTKLLSLGTLFFPVTDICFTDTKFNLVIFLSLSNRFNISNFSFNALELGFCLLTMSECIKTKSETKRITIDARTHTLATTNWTPLIVAGWELNALISRQVITALHCVCECGEEWWLWWEWTAFVLTLASWRSQWYTFRHSLRCLHITYCSQRANVNYCIVMYSLFNRSFVSQNKYYEH